MPYVSQAMAETHVISALVDKRARLDGEIQMRRYQIARLEMELAHVDAVNVVGIAAAAARANRLTIRFRPAHIAEHTVSGILAHTKDLCQREGAGFRGKKEMLCHVSYPLLMHRI